MKSIILTSIFSISLNIAYSQSKYFEGCVTYVYTTIDKYGMKNPIVKEKKLYIKRNTALHEIKMSQGDGVIRIYLNSEKKMMYVFNKEENIIKSYPAPISPEPLNVIEERNEGEGDILGQKCDINYVKHVQQFELMGNLTIDTLSCTFYCSKTNKLDNSKILAGLQNNKNSMMIDGRYDGLPLKVVVKSRDKSIITIMATEIKEMNVDSLIELPPYPIVK